ncbi:MAG: hypothetical protein KGJ55_03240 [Gammaproteobacteria bacterium]|nr:hypothetical protein [Gammaproteobacteria bacterium]
MVVIEFNDAGLIVADGGGLKLESPGYAVAEGRELWVGSPARARARLNPRRTHNRFWYQLDQQPLDPSIDGGARSSADLAYAHLQSLRGAAGDAPVLLAVPGAYDNTQLGLLLGIVRATGLHPIGLVDAAVAAASTVVTHPLCLHLDAQLHRFVLTRLAGGARVARGRADEIAKPGLAALHDAFVAAIADAFVRQVRFDPLHGAHVEQALYDRLPGWLTALSDAPRSTLEMPAGGRSHRASLPREVLSEAVAEAYRQIVAGIAGAVGGADRANVSLLVSHRIAALPGLIERIERECGVACTRLDPLAVTRGALVNADRIRSDGEALAYVTRLPGRTAAAAQRAAPATAARIRLRDGRLWLECEAGADVRVNGAPIEAPRALARGDRIEIGGQELRMMSINAP